MRPRHVFAALFAGTLIWIGPIPDAPAQTQNPNQGRMQEWVARIKQNPKDVEALKGLGIALYESQKYAVAAKCFERAVKLSPKDPEVLFYTGQTQEALGLYSLALKTYSVYKSLPESQFRDRMEERHVVVQRLAVAEEVKKLLASEEAIGSQAVSSDAVAVLPFSVNAEDPQIAPLGKGLAEMLITDLSQIPSLRLVERIRVQSLFDEMALGQAGLVEESQAAQFGKMLAAGRIVRGDLTVPKKNQIRMEAVTVDAVESKASSPVSVADAFPNLFRVEKDLVFKVLGGMGIEPTPQERQRILRVPTKNLQAFIAYCNGLDLEDKGEFGKAAAEYRKAVEIDPGFPRANQKLRTAMILERASISEGLKRESVSGFRDDRAAMPEFDQEALVTDRLNTVQSNIGSNFTLGKDVRKPVQETAAGEEGWDIGGQDLPLPPSPPQVILP